MSEDVNGTVSSNEVNPLNKAQMNLENVEFTSEDIFNVPSPHMTLENMLTLKNRINQAFDSENFDGVVITHGTDTLEETAFFLDITLPHGNPVVITGAMRSSNEVGSDGLYNLLTSIRIAASDKSRNRGVLVVMNDEIHSARYVTKTHTTNVATFQTPTHGPLGWISKGRVIYFHALSDAKHIDIDQVKGTVPIIKAFAGMTGETLALWDSDKLDGIVIEALGAGNLPPTAVGYLEKFIAKGIPVVLASRCFNGIAEPIYAYEGGGKQLYDAGVMFVSEVNSQKARIKLIVGLNAKVKNLRAFIED